MSTSRSIAPGILQNANKLIKDELFPLLGINEHDWEANSHNISRNIYLLKFQIQNIGQEFDNNTDRIQNVIRHNVQQQRNIRKLINTSRQNEDFEISNLFE